jgi:hypothetical protein
MHYCLCKEVIETPTIATLVASGIDRKQRINFRAPVTHRRRRLFGRNASYRQRSVPRQK